MKNIQKLEAIDIIAANEVRDLHDKHMRFFRIVVDVMEVRDDKITVGSTQYSLETGKLLTPKHLYEVGRYVMAPFEKLGFKTRVRPYTYYGQLTKDFDIEGIKYFLKRHRLEQRDILPYLNISESQLSKILNGTSSLTNFSRAAFYWLFKYSYKVGLITDVGDWDT